MERYHQIVWAEPARERVRRYSTPSRRRAVMVEPQACSSSATQISSARGSAAASWPRYSCLQACQLRSAPRASNLGSRASFAMARATGPNLSAILRSSTGRLSGAASSSTWWRMPATMVTCSQP